MEVKIGVRSVPREIVVDTELTADEVRQALADALSSGGFLEVPDDKGGRVMVPVAHLGYVEIGGAEPRRVGFNSF
ncbi:MAG: DUF3107 domain-containing protein [Nocardiopsaceae bacterium]|nr:DUF3107 domain-containing protein [Nocardiopsaceae bacterium]